MADRVIYVRDAKTGELIPIKAVNLDGTYSVSAYLVLLLAARSN